MPIQMRFSEQIEAPPERVFAALTNLDAAARWTPNCVRIEKLTAGPVGPGSQWRATRKLFGREATEHFEVTGYEPNRTLELFVDGTKGSSRRGYYRFRYRLQPEGAATLLDLDGEIGGTGKAMQLLGRLFAGGFKKAIAKDLAAMKRHVEGASASV
jgi:uncharacterized protein YndB with AHSA1/START domain